MCRFLLTAEGLFVFIGCLNFTAVLFVERIFYAFINP